MALRDQWIRDSDGFLIVYSISSRASFACVENIYHQVQRVKVSASATTAIDPGVPSSTTVWKYPGHSPLVLVGNKCDRSRERTVLTQEGVYLARQLNCVFVETSAKIGTNVETPFFGVVRRLRKQRSGGPPEHKNNEQTFRTMFQRSKRRRGRLGDEREGCHHPEPCDQQASGRGKCAIL